MRWREGSCAHEAYSIEGYVMKVDGRHFRSIWLEPDGWTVGAIDQRRLPHDFVVARLTDCDAAADAIRSMLVRGAPLIGATAAYGMALAMRADSSDAALDHACKTLIATRPTAINLKWALDEMRALLRHLPPSERAAAAYSRAGKIAEEDIGINKAIGYHGVPHTVIPDNTGGHLMQHAMVDLVMVGTDRVTANGDVCNKIGTYLKALAAHDNGVPFYVALPSPTIDFSVDDGIKEIPIEQRSADEVTMMTGKTADGRIETVRIVPEGSPVANYGFDVTPARLVTGLITERGLLSANRAALSAAFPERTAAAAE